MGRYSSSSGSVWAVIDIMEVVVQVSDKTITLPLPADTSIATLKSKLEALVGVPAPLQILFSGRRLADTDCVSHCDGEVLLWLCGYPMFPLRLVVSFLYFPLASMTDDEVCTFSKMADTGFSIFSTMWDTGYSIRRKIEQETGIILSDGMLSLGYKRLDDSQTVKEVLEPGVFNLFICKCPIPHSLLAARKIRYEIYSKSSHEDAIGLSETVDSFLKRKNMPESWLVYRDQVLEPSTRLASVQEPMLLGDLLLHIRTGGIASFDFAATSTLPVKIVRDMVEKRLCITGIALICRGLLLKDNLSLGDCGLKKEEIIEVVLCQHLPVESDTERLSVRDSERELLAISQGQLTGEKRDFQWMKLGEGLLYPEEYCSVHSGGQVKSRKNCYPLSIDTPKGMVQAFISDTTSVLSLQEELSRHFGRGELWANSKQVPDTQPLREVMHMTLSFVHPNIHIIGEYLDGTSTDVVVKKHETIGNIRTAFAKKMLVSRSFIRLLFFANTLRCKVALDHIEIKYNCTLTILKATEILVRIKNAHLRLAARPSISIGELMTQIAPRHAINADAHYLSYQGRPLPRAITLASLKSGNDLILYLLNKKDIIVYSDQSFGEIYEPYNLGYSYKTSEWNLLVLWREYLGDDRTLSSYSIGANFILRVFQQTVAAKHSDNCEENFCHSVVKITLPNNEEVVVYIGSCSIKRIKEDIYFATGIPTEIQILTSNHEVLPDNHCISLGDEILKLNLEIVRGFEILKYGERLVVVESGLASADESAQSEIGPRTMHDDRQLRDNAMLPESALRIHKGETRIYVKTPLSPFFPVYIHLTDTVRDIKERLGEMLNSNPTHMKLLGAVVKYDETSSPICIASRVTNR